MSLRKKMLQAISLANRTLDSSFSLCLQYIQNQQHPNGGFKDRSGNVDLYYSTFGADLYYLLKIPFSQNLKMYSLQFEAEQLDFVHLCAWANLLRTQNLLNEDIKNKIIDHLQNFSSADGGFNTEANQKISTLYALFLSHMLYEDLGIQQDKSSKTMISLIHSLKTNDGGFSNYPGQKNGIVTATAAAICLLKEWGEPIEDITIDFILSMQYHQGGFFALKGAPIPDLLSSSTALFALNMSQVEVNTEIHLDFLDSLWTNQGAFWGSWTDTQADLEYTYYGLLMAGLLS